MKKPVKQATNETHIDKSRQYELKILKEFYAFVQDIKNNGEMF